MLNKQSGLTDLGQQPHQLPTAHLQPALQKSGEPNRKRPVSSLDRAQPREAIDKTKSEAAIEAAANQGKS
jgi:hypothetical protein